MEVTMERLPENVKIVGSGSFCFEPKQLVKRISLENF
jgi:hypothetical protein